MAHFKKSDRVEVWCLGSLAQLQKAGPPVLRPRNRNASGGWEADYPGRFEITAVAEIPSAARLLYAVSYASS